MGSASFFKDIQVLKRAVERLVDSAAEKSQVYVWDAGCSTGQTSYSLAIMFAESVGQNAFNNLYIRATDIDETNMLGDVVKRGVYRRDELTGVPKQLFEKYFERWGSSGCFQVTELVRQRVFFRKHDLLSLQPIGEDYSLILCRNVLHRFQPGRRSAIIRMLHGALTPGGYLATNQAGKTITELGKLFQEVAPDERLFRKIDPDYCTISAAPSSPSVRKAFF
jgi:chemotaxis protein methyltransferase CheR